jgi:hypothetical protein
MSDQAIPAESISLASALFQAHGWLKAKYPKGSMEYEIAEICWQAHEALEEADNVIEAGRLPMDSEGLDQGAESQGEPPGQSKLRLLR